LRFEAGPANLLDSLLLEGNRIHLNNHPVDIQIDMLQARFGPYLIRTESGRNEDHCWVDWIIYSGEESEFDLTGVSPAVFAWATCISVEPNDPVPCPPPRHEIRDHTLSMQMDGLNLMIKTLPARERELQHDKIHPLDE
jgi:hypothetical protein